MRVVMIIGEPCVGKSLLVKELMKLTGPFEFSSVKYVPHHYSPSRGLIILGRYDEPHKFPGTDRMSMASQPHVLKWLNQVSELGYKNVLFEGDRLGNASMIDAILACGWELQVIHLWLRPAYLNKRRAEQRPDQSASFVRSRETKIRNLRNRLLQARALYNTYEHVTLADTHNIIAFIRKGFEYASR